MDSDTLSEIQELGRYPQDALFAQVEFAFQHRQERDVIEACESEWRTDVDRMVKARMYFARLYHKDATRDQMLIGFYLAEMGRENAYLYIGERGGILDAPAWEIRKEVDAWKANRKARRKPRSPKMITCPNCGHEFIKETEVKEHEPTIE